MRIDLAGNWYREVRGNGFEFTHPDPEFKVRKSQLGKDIVVGYRNESPYDSYVLKKSPDKGIYTIETIYKKKSHFGNILIRKFVDEEIDFYYLDGKIYNENNEEEDNIVDVHYLWIFARASNVYLIRDNIYLVYHNKNFLTIFDYKPKVVFLVDESMQKWFTNAGANTYIFRDILLKFRINKYFVKSLAKLGTIEEMSKSLKDYLLMSIV